MSEQQPKEKKKKKTAVSKSAVVSAAAPSVDVNLEHGVSPQEGVIKPPPAAANEVKKKKKKTPTTSKSAGKKTKDDDDNVVANNDPVALEGSEVQTSSENVPLQDTALPTPSETAVSDNVRSLLSLSEKEVGDSISPLKSSQQMTRPTSRGKAMDKLNSTNSDKLQVSTHPNTSIYTPDYQYTS